MARSGRSGGKELHLLKSILNSSSQCSLSEDPKPKETMSGESGDDANNQKTDTDDSPATSSRGGLGDGQRVSRPKTSHGGRMLESRRRNPRTIRDRRASVDDAGNDAADRRQRMYQRVCVDEERTEPTVGRKGFPKSRVRSARKAEYVAVHTNSLEQKYQELRDLLESQFLQEREELNRTLLKQTRQVMHKYRMAQSGYAAPRPMTAPATRRRRPRAMRENDTQSTQTDESVQSRHIEDDIRFGEAGCDGDTFILIDGTKENGVSVTKHVTFVSADEESVHHAAAGSDVIDSDQQNFRIPGRLQRGRGKTRDNGATRRRRKQKTEADSTVDSVQRTDDTSARDSDSSSGSTGCRGRRRLSDASNSPSTTASTSPSRGSSSVGPMCDHHLKYSSNTKLIEWLRRKNRVYRHQVAEERKAARKKRREEEEQQREKEMKREEGKHAMELWLKKKKSEDRLLRKRQRTEAAYNLQQQLNSNIDNEVTLGTTVFLRSRDSRDGSTSARGKQYASSVSNTHAKTGKPKHAIHGRTDNSSRVDDSSDVTVLPSARNDHDCMCGFSGDPNVSPFITGTMESRSEQAKCADTEQTRPDSLNKQLPGHDHRSKQNTPSKARLGSSGKAPERRQSTDTKRKNVTRNNRLHKVHNQQKSGELKSAGDEETHVTDATPAAANAGEVPATTGRGKPSAGRPTGTVGKARRRRMRASQGELIEEVHAENAVNDNTAGVDDAAEPPQSGKSGENGQETPQSKESGRTPRRPSSSRPRSARRGSRKLSFAAPSPPKQSASPTVGQSDANVSTSGRGPRKGRQRNARPASAASSLSASRSTCEKRPVTPKPELACTRPGYENVQYQQKSWDSFSGHVWKQVNDDESDHAERPEPQGSDKPDDNRSTVSESRDVTSVDTSSAAPAADADTDGKGRDASEKSNEDKKGDEMRNDCGDSASQAKVETGESMESPADRPYSSPTAGTGGETSEDVRTSSSDTDGTLSDDSAQEDVEVESDSSASTQPNVAARETMYENDTGGVCVERDTTATDAVTKTDTPSPVDVKGKRDENDNMDKDVTPLTNVVA